MALGWDLYDYNHYQFECGLGYLNTNVLHTNHRKQMEYARSFWMWWVRQWDIRDRAFVHHMELDMDMASKLLNGVRYDMLELYKMDHNPAELKVFPSRVVENLIADEIRGRLKIVKR